MTENKRFTLSKDTEWWFVQDNTIQVNEYGYRDDLTGEDKYRGLRQDLTEQEVVDLLNTLHEENNAFKNIIQHFIVKEFKITKEDIIHGKGGDATDFSSVIDEFFNKEVNISEIQIELKGEKKQ